MASLINGTAYSFTQIRIQFTNTNIPLAGVTAISYKKTRQKENFYATGSKAYERGYGNEEFEASITLKMSDVVQLRKQSPDNDLTLIPRFDVIVSYLHPDATKVTTDILKNVEFLEDGFDGSQGDMSMEIELPLIISDVEFAK